MEHSMIEQYRKGYGFNDWLKVAFALHNGRHAVIQGVAQHVTWTIHRRYRLQYPSSPFDVRPRDRRCLVETTVLPTNGV